MQIVAIIMSLASIGCWIFTLVKMFTDSQDGGVLKGILGIICPLWAFIWGWMNSGKHKTRNIMLVWTVAIAAGTALNVMGMGDAGLPPG